MFNSGYSMATQYFCYYLLFMIFWLIDQIHFGFCRMNFIILLISHELLPYYVHDYYISNPPPPGGSGWIMGVIKLGNLCTASAVSDPEGDGGYARAIVQAFETSFFIHARLTFFHIYHFLPSTSVFLSYFTLAIAVRECLGKDSCMSPHFLQPCCMVLVFFRQCNNKCTMCVTVLYCQLKLYCFGVYNLLDVQLQVAPFQRGVGELKVQLRFIR